VSPFRRCPLRFVSAVLFVVLLRASSVGVAEAAELNTSGSVPLGGSVTQSVTATASGAIALRLEWSNPNARLALYLLRRGADGVYRRVASATGVEMPQVIVRDSAPGSYRVRIVAVRGSTGFTLWRRYPTAPPAHPRQGYVTVMFGRSMIGSAANCALRPGAVSLLTVAGLLKARGIAATSNATIDQVGTCTKTIRYASWAQLATLRDRYGWTLTSRGETSRILSTLTPAEQQEETCGSLPAFAGHGFTRAWGMYAYPGGEPVMSVQNGPVARCFAYGRDYEPASNPYPLAAPYLASTYDILGGRCHNPALGCYLMNVTIWNPSNSRWYTPPPLLAAYANAGLDGTGRWQLLQWYMLVQGHSGTTTSGTPSWNCDSADWRDHWTSDPELYCLSDMLWVVDRIDPRVHSTDPATLGAEQGRDFTAAVRHR
jgi:hypothetical protein